MIDPQAQPVVQRRVPTPWTVAFVVLLVIVLSFGLVAQLIGALVAYMFYDGGDLMMFASDLASPTGKENMKIPLWIAQGITTMLGLAVLPYLFWWNLRRKSFKTFFENPPIRPIHLLLVLGIVISSSAVISVFIEWNTNLEYPGEFGRWSREIEDKATELTSFMTSFTNVGQYLVAVLIIAVFGGFAEEVAFRGLLQPELQKALNNNHHAAIWISAIFFSALHLQFYGFFPRVLLGALFGYLYYWSGNLIVPMFAHFVNNFFAVTMIYLGVSELPGTKDTPSLPWYGVVISGLIAAALIYYFRKTLPKPAPNDVTA